MLSLLTISPISFPVFTCNLSLYQKRRRRQSESEVGQTIRVITKHLLFIEASLDYLSHTLEQRAENLTQNQAGGNLTQNQAGRNWNQNQRAENWNQNQTGGNWTQNQTGQEGLLRVIALQCSKSRKCLDSVSETLTDLRRSLAVKYRIQPRTTTEVSRWKVLKWKVSKGNVSKGKVSKYWTNILIGSILTASMITIVRKVYCN